MDSVSYVFPADRNGISNWNARDFHMCVLDKGHIFLLELDLRKFPLLSY